LAGFSRDLLRSRHLRPGEDNGALGGLIITALPPSRPKSQPNSLAGSPIHVKLNFSTRHIAVDLSQKHKSDLSVAFYINYANDTFLGVSEFRG